jgi:hypothetical protein
MVKMRFFYNETLPSVSLCVYLRNIKKNREKKE